MVNYNINDKRPLRGVNIRITEDEFVAYDKAYQDSRNVNKSKMKNDFYRKLLELGFDKYSESITVAPKVEPEYEIIVDTSPGYGEQSAASSWSMTKTDLARALFNNIISCDVYDRLLQVL